MNLNRMARDTGVAAWGSHLRVRCGSSVLPGRNHRTQSGPLGSRSAGDGRQGSIKPEGDARDTISAAKIGTAEVVAKRLNVKQTRLRLWRRRRWLRRSRRWLGEFSVHRHLAGRVDAITKTRASKITGAAYPADSTITASVLECALISAGPKGARPSHRHIRERCS